MFGFRVPETFDRPYAALSVTELAALAHVAVPWFRDYIYHPARREPRDDSPDRSIWTQVTDLAAHPELSRFAADVDTIVVELVERDAYNRDLPSLLKPFLDPAPASAGERRRAASRRGRRAGSLTA
jgi:hypothetical protein